MYDRIDELVKEESRKPKGWLYCPKCGSARITYFLGSCAGQIYECRDCGYRGSFVIEDGRMAKETRRRWIEKRECEGRST